MLKRLGGFFYDRRHSVPLVALALLIAAAVYGFGVFGNLKSAGFTNPSSQSARADDFINTHLPNSTTDVIVLLHSDTLTVSDPAFEQAVTTMIAALKARPEVAGLSSYYDTQSQDFVSTDRHSTYVAVQLAQPKPGSTKDKEYSAISPLFTAPPLQVKLGGQLVANDQINTQTGSDIEHAEMYTFPIVLVLLLIVFGSVVAALLPLAIGVMAILGAFAIVHVLTTFTDVSIFSLNIITGMGLGLAIDYGLFIVTRFREELSHDQADVRGAVQRTMATAGRTVLFSGLTVCTSMLSLLLFPEYFLRSMGLGAIAAVLMAMLAAITILPAILSLLGPRVNALAIRRQRQLADVGEQHGAWYRLSQGVMRFPIPVALGVLAVLVLLGSPFLRVSFRSFAITDLPTELSSRQVYDQLSQQFPHQTGAQITVAVQTPGSALSSGNLAALDGYVQQLQAVPGVVQVQSLVTVSPQLTLAQYQQLYSQPGSNPLLDATAARIAHSDATRIDLTLSSPDNSSAAVSAVSQIRALAPPAGFTTYVGGATADQMDLFANLKAIIPQALALIALSVLVLLFLMTGSVVMPLKAIVLNLLSLSATFGALVFIFQEGHFANLLQIQTIGPLESTQPVLIFAIAFGLSMDYEVFLLSRIKERYDATGDNQLSVASGLQRTGGLITSAALLLAVVLGAFATSAIVFIKMLGVGLTLAVLIDATLVRGLLVPATMRLLGRANWWAPAPLRWLWRRIGLSEAEMSGSLPQVQPARH
jgi:uncharacterized membrane protein YdfJ with MMPL/SSD domain